MNTPKDILFDEEAKHALLSGIDQLADAVAVTLGPVGRNVGLEASGSPSITGDGYSVAREIELKDPFVNIGASFAKEVSRKIKEKAGDGTTTGIVLLRALVKEGVRNITAGANPIALKRGMDKALHAVLEKIDTMAVKIATKEETQNIAVSSASGNREVGKTIAECFEKIGTGGVITIESGQGTETSIEIVNGMQFDRGYLSPYFVTDQEKMIVEMQEALLLITDKKISSPQEILPVLQHVAASSANLVIIADDIDGDALSTLVMNKLKGTIKVAALKAPGFGEQRKALLEDLAILTGATLITEETGYVLKDTDPSSLGKASSILITKEKTTVIGGFGNETQIKERISHIAAELKKVASDYERKRLDERKAKLQGGVAVIKVGAWSTAELEKKKQLFSDSLNSTKAALEEGIVPGGGIALVRSGGVLIDLDEEERIGASVLFKALAAPLRQIAENAGADSSLILGQVLLKEGAFGFNALTHKIEDLYQAGVVEAAKVVKTALSAAVSVAGVTLLSEALIAPSKN